MSSHNQMNDRAKKGDFLGQEKLILGHNMTNYVEVCPYPTLPPYKTINRD
jgi:hypothetical protein